MDINIPESKIEEIIKEQVDKSVRKRIKEMQGDYTSKSFIENIIGKVIWSKIYEIVPDVETYIKDEVERCIKCALESNIQITKKQLVDLVIEGLLEKL